MKEKRLRQDEAGRGAGSGDGDCHQGPKWPGHQRLGLEVHAQNSAGQFSGMHLVSIMYAAFKRIAPDVDGGIDLSKEYETALAMRGTK